MNFLEILGQYMTPHVGGGMSAGSGLALVLMFGAMIASMVISGTLQSRFKKYSQVATNLTGAQVAERMLRENGITDVRVVSVPGMLTDHYDPMKKTVNLSEGVYHMNSVAAAAVAAHECGHAVQHKVGYAWLSFRSFMVPAVQLASKLMNVLMILLFISGLVMIAKLPVLIYLFLGAMGLTTLFAVVTLPVEFDASRRALAWLDSSGSVRGVNHGMAQNALFWAAMTYVAGAVAAIAQLAYFAMMFLGGRRD
ncbi:zinc metallopeptidase [Haloferula sargassicola]|uniref:Zinc metallopeptidase n=1 Tax=Haloferula sargassicola TaxID=490096 RepID=A0ABP9UNS6_9BACT